MTMSEIGSWLEQIRTSIRTTVHAQYQQGTITRAEAAVELSQMYDHLEIVEFLEAWDRDSASKESDKEN